MAQMEFTRGDGVTHTFAMPATSWSAGGKLYFAAKTQIDDDDTDASVVIRGAFDDTVVEDTTINGVAYKKYTCYFPPAATNSIESEGASQAEYIGEFQFVSSDGVPRTFPPTDQKIDVILYFDIKRKTTS